MSSEWYIRRGDHWAGPLPADTVRMMIEQESLKLRELVRCGDEEMTVRDAGCRLGIWEADSEAEPESVGTAMLPAVVNPAKADKSDVSPGSSDDVRGRQHVLLMRTDATASTQSTASMRAVESVERLALRSVENVEPPEPLPIWRMPVGEWLRANRKLAVRSLAVVAGLGLVIGAMSFNAGPWRDDRVADLTVDQFAAMIGQQRFSTAEFFNQFGGPSQGAADYGDQLGFEFQCRDGRAEVLIVADDFATRSIVTPIECRRR